MSKKQNKWEREKRNMQLTLELSVVSLSDSLVPTWRRMASASTLVLQCMNTCASLYGMLTRILETKRESSKLLSLLHLLKQSQHCSNISTAWQPRHAVVVAPMIARERARNQRKVEIELDWRREGEEYWTKERSMQRWTLWHQRQTCWKCTFELQPQWHTHTHTHTGRKCPPWFPTH